MTLHREEHGAAPLAAHADALEEPKSDEQPAGSGSDLLRGGQQAHEQRRDAHQGQRGDERRFAAHTVAHVPEDGAAQGARQKAHENRGERLHEAFRAAVCKEQPREDQAAAVP
jgi:hypothetical protein